MANQACCRDHGLGHSYAEGKEQLETCDVREQLNSKVPTIANEEQNVLRRAFLRCVTDSPSRDSLALSVEIQDSRVVARL